MSIDRWMDKEDVIHIYNGILLSHKKEWNNAIAATWMDLEIIILSEVRQRKPNIIFNLYVESEIWYNWTYLQNRNRLTDKENKLTVTKGKRGGRINCEFGINRYTLLYIKIDKQQGPTV